MARSLHPLSRLLCSLPPAPPPSISALHSSLRGEARAVARAVHEARSATALAGSEGSDEEERHTARRLTKHALQRYVALVARGDPPVLLSENGAYVLEREELRLGGRQGGEQGGEQGSVRGEEETKHVIVAEKKDGESRGAEEKAVQKVEGGAGKVKNQVWKVPEPAKEERNDVMRVLGDEVNELKNELFMSNKQRVWIGWRGWF